MKKIIFFAVSVLLFSNCAKKATVYNLQDNNAELIQNNSTVQTLTDEKEFDIISDITIEKISFYIYNELKPKWTYNGYEDLYRTYNITENNILNENSIENWNSHGNFIIFKEYNCENYIITIWTLSDYPEHITFYSIELNINENNYLGLFPYMNIEDYIKDNSFGDIVELDEEKGIINYIYRYGEDDRIGYSDLIFEEGILKAIRISSYLT